MPKENQSKKTNIFKRLWNKIGSRGRIVLASVAYLGLWAVPLSFPLQMGCLAVVAYESKLVQKGIAKLRRRFPKTSKKIVSKIMKNKYTPNVLKEILRKTDPKVFFADNKNAVSPIVQIKRDFSSAIKKAMSYRDNYRASLTKPKKTIDKNKLVVDIISKQKLR